MDYLIYILLVPVVIFIIIIVGIVAFFSNRNNANHMDPNQTNQIRPKTNAKDFFLNLGAFIAFYTLVVSLINLLFTIINTAYPQITTGYNYSGSSSISWPVSILIVFFPIFILLMWFLEREYRTEPDLQSSVTHRGLTYITLFISGLAIAGDLITVVYYFIDGQELTTGFIMKVLVLLIIATSIFIYYISDLRRELKPKSRIFWRVLAGVIIFGSIIWGFAVLGSPRTQQLLKYDQQKVSDLQNINNAVRYDYTSKGILPNTLVDLSTSNAYYATFKLNDTQTNKPYEYEKTSELVYQLCATFNKDSKENGALNSTYLNYPNDVAYGSGSWTHPAGHFCFTETVQPNLVQPGIKPMPVSY